MLHFDRERILRAQRTNSWRVDRILSNNPSRRATRGAGEVDAMTQIRTSESSTHWSGMACAATVVVFTHTRLTSRRRCVPT